MEKLEIDLRKIKSEAETGAEEEPSEAELPEAEAEAALDQPPASENGEGSSPETEEEPVLGTNTESASKVGTEPIHETDPVLSPKTEKNGCVSFGPMGSLSKKTIMGILAVIGVCVLVFGISVLIAAQQIRSDAAEEARAMAREKNKEVMEIDMANALRESAVDTVIEKEAIPAYSVSQVMQMDVSKPSGVTVEDLKKVTSQGLVGLEEAFWQAEQDYGINCLFVMAIAAIESGNGTINGVGNNMFGWGGGYIAFSSKAEGIDVVASGLAKNYLTPGAGLYSGNTISSVNKRYASSSTWDDKVANKMASYYATISKTHNAALEKLQ